MSSDHVPGERTVGGRDLTHWRTSPGRWLSELIARLATVISAWVGGKPNHIALWIVAIIGAGLAAAATAVAAEVYDDVVESDGIAGIDEPVLREAVAWRTPTRDDAITAYTDLGGPMGMTILAVVTVVVLAIRWRSRLPVVLMAIATAGSLAMTVVGKELVGRARPDQSLAVPPYETSASFPSGHTLNATVVVGILAYLLLPHLATRWARVLTIAVATAFAVTMGLSRVFLGHHWLTDVIAAWALGLAWVSVVVTAHRIFLTMSDEHQASSSTHESPDRVNPRLS